MKSYKGLFTRALAHIPAHKHAAAHSHHLRPDAVAKAHMQCMEDVFQYADRKWEQCVFKTVYPAGQKHVARVLSTEQPENVVFATNTHELLLRLLSCFAPGAPVRILTTDSEFYSASRQLRRHKEAGLVAVTRIAVEPFDTFPARFAEAFREKGPFDLVFLSQVFFNSGYAVPDLKALTDLITTKETFVVIDGYHAFMALPTDLSALKDRVFYMAGGYKYAMSGEGSCFLHAPAAYGPRPINTGWFADADAPGETVPYEKDAGRFLGATFDPTGLYRFNAAVAMLEKEKITVRDIHDRIMILQFLFVEQLKKKNVSALTADKLAINLQTEPRGHFLTFRTEKAGALQESLMKKGIITDHRGNRLRFGFGLYHDPEDMEKMAVEIAAALA